MFPSSEGVRVANTQKTSHALSFFFAGLSGFGVTRMLFWAIVIIEGENYVAVKKDATPSTPPLKKKQTKRPKFKMCGFSTLFPSFPNPLSKSNLPKFFSRPTFLSVLFHFICFFFFPNEFSLLFAPSPSFKFWGMIPTAWRD